MKPERTFVAERALAQHCAALLRPAPSSSELLPLLSRVTERLVRILRGALAPLAGGETPLVEYEGPAELSFEDFAGTAIGLHAHSVYSAGIGTARLLTTIDADAVLRLVDRAFGGKGEAPRPMPRELPMSGELMVQRIETIIAARLGEALASPAGRAIRPLHRDTNLGQLQPFVPSARLAVLTLVVTEQGGSPWKLRLALPLAALADLLGEGEGTRAPRARAAPPDPLAAPFADMPLPVRAVLVDVPLPLSAISKLEVGQILSVPIARSVPVRVGTRTVAHGSIGAVDDRVAIQITQLS